MTLEYLCRRLSLTSQELNHFIEYQKKYVYPFTKQKLNKVRHLHNTHPNYKELLRKINRIIQQGVYPTGVLGGVKGKDIVDVAKVHCGKEAFFSLDLKDFFPNIKRAKVYKVFARAKCTPEVSEILSDLVTYGGAVPQGFPTSTSIANWVVYDLDMQQLSHCQKYGITRTRWVDDITFSGTHEAIQHSIKPLIGAVKFHGFKVNNRKTDYSVRPNGATVVGLDVTGKAPKLPPSTVLRINKMVADCCEYGQEYVRLMYGIDEKKRVQNSLNGYIKYVARYNPVEAKEMNDIFVKIDWRK